MRTTVGFNPSFFPASGLVEQNSATGFDGSAGFHRTQLGSSKPRSAGTCSRYLSSRARTLALRGASVEPDFQS
ncbi:hypothetical protein SLA2020_159020 [Shorea laevis]